MKEFIKQHRYILTLILILIVATFFRFYKLSEIPAGLYPDVAMNGNNGIYAIETGDFKIFYPENNGREGFFINLQAITMKFFSFNVWSLKIVAAIIGIMTVLGLYLFTKELFKNYGLEIKNGENKKENPNSLFLINNSESIALLSAFFTAVSFWHVNFSRIGFRAIMIPFVMVFSFYFLYRGLHNHRATDFIIAGAFFGLGFHTYISFRIAPLILLIPIFFGFIEYWQKNRAELKHLLKTNRLNFLKKIFKANCAKHWLIFFASALLVALPLILYFINNPADFIGRAGQVSVFNSSAPIKDLISSIIKTLGQFNFAGDYNWRHNYSGSPQLLWPVGILFIIGLIISIKEIIKKENYCQKKHFLLSNLYFLLSWLFIMLTPSFLSSEGIPHALRSIGAIPPTMIFAGIGGVLIYEKLKTYFKLNNTQRFAIYALLLAIIVYGEYNKYFNDWANRPETKASFDEYYVQIGNFLNSIPNSTKKYVAVNAGGVLVNGIPMPAQTVKFITYGKTKISYLIPTDNIKENVSIKENSVIVPLVPSDAIFKEFQNALPGIIKQKDKVKYFEISN